MRGISLGVAAATLVSTAVAADVDPIVIKGSKFFYKTNGTEFFMKGVAYQADYNGAVSGNANTSSTDSQFNDPLADPTGCARDIPLMTALGINSIRVYAIDTTKDHTKCFQLLNNAGIYVVLDLSEPGLSIDRDSPAWDLSLYQRYTSVIDATINNTNVIGYFAGNEVTNNATNTDASPFVKAAVRDMKAYLTTKKYRTAAIGYASNDDSDIRGPLADYFNCGERDESIDMFGYNIYSWCDPSSIQTSGWDVRVEEYRNYSVPVFWAEYGCNTNRPRTWGEVTALYSSDISDVISGGIIYMWFEETNKYGLVQVQSNKQVTKLQDYNNLLKVLPKADPAVVQANSYSPTNTALRTCPTSDANWSASTVLPPTPDTNLCSCMQASLSCVEDSVDAKDYGELFGYICDKVDSKCAGISGNGTTGSYGAYSMCSANERLSWAMNDYYQQFNGAQGSAACSFDSRAKSQSASNSNQCKTAINNAGGAAGTSTSSSGSGSTQSKNAAPMTIPSFSTTAISAVVVMITAFFGGAGLVLY